MIHPATPSDVPAILGLLRELAAYEQLSHACIATEALLQEHLFGTDRAAESLVADEGGTVVAYAIFFKTFSTFLARPSIYLEDLYVQPAHRRKGIGKALLRHLAQLAVERHYGRVEWSVLDWNQPSIEFYKSLGAVPLEEWTMFRLTGESLEKFAEDGTLKRDLRNAFAFRVRQRYTDPHDRPQNHQNHHLAGSARAGAHRGHGLLFRQ